MKNAIKVTPPNLPLTKGEGLMIPLLPKAPTVGKVRGGEGALCNYDHGFTLLEMLIAVTIISVVVVIIGGAMRLGFKSVNTGERKIEALERMRVSLGVIDAQIQSSFFLPVKAKPGEAAPDTMPQFKGDHQGMQLSTNYSLWGGESGSIVVTYRVEQDEKGYMSLYASESMTGGNNPRELKLLEGHREISFDYFYKGPTDEKGSWVEQWTDDQAVPEKIRVNLLKDGKDLTLILPIRSRPSTGTIQARKT